MAGVDTVHCAIRFVCEATLKHDGWPDALASIAEAIGAHKLMLNVMFVMDPDKPNGRDPNVIARIFHPTRREAALATLLARGIDLADAALQLGISVGTARGYLKQVLAKTYTHRQAELVALLLRGCVLRTA
jgi:DNA-binding CsgD family transcriptional regulator